MSTVLDLVQFHGSRPGNLQMTLRRTNFTPDSTLPLGWNDTDGTSDPVGPRSLTELISCFPDVYAPIKPIQSQEHPDKRLAARCFHVPPRKIHVPPSLGNL